MDIQLEWIIAYTYTMDDVYQLALKIEGLKFQASKHPSHKLGVLSPTKQQANHLAQQFPKLLTMWMVRKIINKLQMWLIETLIRVERHEYWRQKGRWDSFLLLSVVGTIIMMCT